MFIQILYSTHVLPVHHVRAAVQCEISHKTNMSRVFV